MTRPRYLLASAVLIAMAVLLVLGYAAFGPKTHKVLAQAGTPPVGSYGFLVQGSPFAPGSSPTGAVGVINIDGAGNITGSYTSYDPNGSQPPQTGTFTGNITSSNPDGTGTFTIMNPNTQQYAFVTANSNSQISFLLTSDSSGISAVVTGVATRQ